MSEPADVTATRTAYDTVAADYAAVLREELAGKPLDRALLGTFAELVRAAGGGQVADVGCGPGRVADHLHRSGLDVVGIDLSPAMIAVARRSYPHLRFDVGSMTALDRPDGAFGGLVAWYSVIHTPAERLPAVFTEFRRVLCPGAPVLLAFQVGADERRHLSEGYGHSVSLDAYRRSPGTVSALLADAGIAVRTTVVREPDPPEKTPQAYLLGVAR